MPQGTMKALWYSAPKNFDIRDVPIPACGDDEVLLKVHCCGVCGTDGHIHEGEHLSLLSRVSLISFTRRRIHFKVPAHPRPRSHWQHR
ncbi:hypothetical protein C8F01DRAFT_1151311 [Mycena amicta]|nr:hypothetical protein C8F01DRAFT_1151311 [Mycena amicta]